MPESAPSALSTRGSRELASSRMETSRASPSAPSMRISIRCTPASYSGMSASSASSTTRTQMPPSHTTSTLSAGNTTSCGSSASPGVSACAIISSRRTDSEKARAGGGSGSESERSVRPPQRPNLGGSGGAPVEAPWWANTEAGWAGRAVVGTGSTSARAVTSACPKSRTR